MVPARDTGSWLPHPSASRIDHANLPQVSVSHSQLFILPPIVRMKILSSKPSHPIRAGSIWHPCYKRSRGAPSSHWRSTEKALRCQKRARHSKRPLRRPALEFHDARIIPSPRPFRKPGIQKQRSPPRTNDIICCRTGTRDQGRSETDPSICPHSALQAIGEERRRFGALANTQNKSGEQSGDLAWQHDVNFAVHAEGGSTSARKMPACSNPQAANKPFESRVHPRLPVFGTRVTIRQMKPNRGNARELTVTFAQRRLATHR